MIRPKERDCLWPESWFPDEDSDSALHVPRSNVPIEPEFVRKLSTKAFEIISQTRGRLG